MIIEGLISLFCHAFSLLLTPFEAISLPFNFINVLATISGFGTYLVGADLLIMIVGCVMFWTSVKVSVGIILFIWDILPFS